MTKYKAIFHKSYRKDLKKIKKSFDLITRLNKKVKEILKDPYTYKPLRNVLKNKRRVRFGSYVLVFEVQEEEKVVIFHALEHHDEIYKDD